MAYQTIRRDVSRKDPRDLAQLLAQYTLEALPTLRQLRAALTTFLTAIDDGAVTFGGRTIRMVTGVPTDADPNGSLAISDIGVFSRQGGVWVAL